MTTNPTKPQPRPDRRNEKPFEPGCATHEATVILIVRANVQEGTTEAQLIEYISAHLENRSPDIDGDIWDELGGLAMRVRGRGMGTNGLMVCAARLIQQDETNVIYAGPLAEVAL